MKVQISSNHVDLSKHHRDFIKEQMISLESICKKVTGESVSCKVSVENANLKHHFKVSALLIVPGLDMRAWSSKSTLEASVKDLVSKLAKQVKKYKSKHEGRKRILMDESLKKSEIKSPMLSEIVESDDSDDKKLLKKITKRKVFSDLIPMTPLEALKAMIDFKHDLFVFVNKDTDRYNLLYTRHNNKGIGLVELESKTGVLNYKLSELL